jgi:hypothetical protein
MKKSAWIIFLFASFILILGILSFLFPPPPQNLIRGLLASVASPTSSPHKTYSNLKYGFQLAYPYSLTVTSPDSETINFHSSFDFKIRLMDNLNREPLITWIQHQQQSGILTSPEKIKSSLVTLGKNSWFKFEDQTVTQIPAGYVAYSLGFGSKSIIVINYGQKNNEPEIESVLSTLKFTK